LSPTAVHIGTYRRPAGGAETRHHEHYDQPTENGAEEQVRQLGRRWAEAEERGDAEAPHQLLADDFVLVGPLGFMLDKQQFLGSRLSGDLRHKSFTWEDVRIRVYGEAAVAVGSQTQRSTY
jgi:ketosteroid isomerase-like protein